MFIDGNPIVFAPHKSIMSRKLVRAFGQHKLTVYYVVSVNRHSIRFAVEGTNETISIQGRPLAAMPELRQR